MKKNNAKVSQKGLKRDARNKARKKRSTALKDFNNKTFQVKLFQDYIKQLENQENNHE